jgi:hypothetical protein
MARARRLALVTLLAAGVVVWARPALAQEAGPDRIDLLTHDFTPTLMNASALSAVRLTMPASAPATELVSLQPVVPQRPKFGTSKSLLNSLYATTALMQALDIHSTYRALNAGAIEGNPAMGRLTSNPGAFIATKAAVAAGSIWAANRIAKKNKVAAIVTLVAVNSAYAMIVSHNYRLARGW